MLATMHRFAAAIMVAAVAAAASVAASAARPSAPQAALTGRVTIIQAGQVEPVRRAKVTLTAGDSILTTDTDTDGWYRFDTLRPGPVRVRAAKLGLVMPGRGRLRDLGPSVTVATAEPTRLDIQMVAGAAIEGRVIDESGQPVAGTRVSVVRFGYDLIGRHPIDVVDTTTNLTGAFRLHTLPAGAYYLRARPDASADPVRIPGQTPRVPAMTYYPATPRPDQAGRIEIGAGQQLSGMDIVVGSMTAGLVSGKVVRSSGDAPPRMSVRLQAIGGPVGAVRGGFLRETGDFFYRAVPPGDYWLSAVALTATGQLEASVQRLSTNGADITGLQLQTAPGRDVLAFIVTEGGAPAPPGITVTAPETAVNLPTPIEGPDPDPILAPAPGGINLGPLFGPRLIRVDDVPPGFALAAVLLNGTDITDTPVDFQAMPGPVEVRLATSVGRATGVVRTVDGRPLAGLDVVVFSADDAAWGGLSRWVKATESRADGSFVVEGLLPGQYYVAAGTLETNSWMSPDVLRRLVTGTPIDIATGQTTEVVIPSGGFR